MKTVFLVTVTLMKQWNITSVHPENANKENEGLCVYVEKKVHFEKVRIVQKCALAVS